MKKRIFFGKTLGGNDTVECKYLYLKTSQLLSSTLKGKMRFFLVDNQFVGFKRRVFCENKLSKGYNAKQQYFFRKSNVFITRLENHEVIDPPYDRFFKKGGRVWGLSSRKSCRYNLAWEIYCFVVEFIKADVEDEN